METVLLEMRQIDKVFPGVKALSKVDFTLKAGEIHSLMGENGAGKSTMLKLLSRVTAPTTGNIKVKGRIASLLEVGTGFHLSRCDQTRIDELGGSGVLLLSSPRIRLPAFLLRTPP